jgi:predicted Co/Zn/Cd cation transporter (cation efflux family)
MMKLIALFSLVPSIALAHPGHHDGGVAHDAAVTNPVFAVALCVALTYVVARIAKRVRS